MILGIMQPYFFPYVGYFDLINYADRWVVFDDVSYIRHGWINRNRILHPTDGWQYIVAPVIKKSTRGTIAEVEMSEHADWRSRVLGQLEHYRKTARYFSETAQLVEDCLSAPVSRLSTFNVHCLGTVCAHLGIEFTPLIQSELQLDIGPISEPGDWALEISKAMGADEYVNPVGGMDLFNAEAFEEAGIILTIRETPDLSYDCRNYEFVPKLSIIDVLMWCSPADIKAWLDSSSVKRAPLERVSGP